MSDELQDNPPGPGRKPPRKPMKLIQRDSAVRRITDRLRLNADWIAITDRPLLRAFSQLERLSIEIYERLKNDGPVRDDGTPHPALEKLIQLRRVQTNLGSQLGLTPKGRVELLSTNRGVPVEAEVDSALTRIDEMRRARGDDVVVVENGTPRKSQD